MTARVRLVHSAALILAGTCLTAGCAASDRQRPIETSRIATSVLAPPCCAAAPSRIECALTHRDELLNGVSRCCRPRHQRRDAELDDASHNRER